MGLLSGVKSFLVDKFWKPIVDESVFYNPFNTAAYSTIFALAAAYIGFPTLKKLGVDLDRDFFIGMMPFVLLAGSLRSLKDVEALNTILLETPLIYILMFIIVTLSILASKKASSGIGIDEHRLMFGTGALLLIATLPFFSVNNPFGLGLIMAVTSIWIVLFYIGLRAFRPGLLKPWFYLPVGAHYMDASVTSVALLFPGTAEKHVLARFFIDLFGPFAGMFLMKSLIIVPSVYYVEKEAEGEKKIYYLFLIAVLGFAIATRNFLSFIALT